MVRLAPVLKSPVTGGFPACTLTVDDRFGIDAIGLAVNRSAEQGIWRFVDGCEQMRLLVR